MVNDWNKWWCQPLRWSDRTGVCLVANAGKHCCPATSYTWGSPRIFKSNSGIMCRVTLWQCLSQVVGTVCVWTNRGLWVDTLTDNYPTHLPQMCVRSQIPQGPAVLLLNSLFIAHSSRLMSSWDLTKWFIRALRPVGSLFSRRRGERLLPSLSWKLNKAFSKRVENVIQQSGWRM